MINIYHGDCLEEYKKIKPGSIDLILCDPPYGTITNFENSNVKHGLVKKTQWDIAINPNEIFKIANTCLRMNGKIILFCQEPYTSKLIQSSFENIEFCYRMIWKKDHFANSLQSKKAPVSYFEDILVFYKKYDLQGQHPLRKYFFSVLEFINKSNKEIANVLGHRKAEHCFYVTPKEIDNILGHQKDNHSPKFGSSQFQLCTKEVYQELITVFNIDKMNGFLSWNNLDLINTRFKSRFKSRFNLPKGVKYKSNILEYSKDYDGFHPTQKPILLLEDLIKTYSNNGDEILDFTMGSGSTGIACWNTNRKFIGIEKDKQFFDIAKKRIENHQKQLRLFQ